jgi:hypothetical protein
VYAANVYDMRAWSNFPTGGGAPGWPLSFQVLLHPCLHIMLAMYSEFICIHMIACHHVHRLHSTCTSDVLIVA